MAGWREAEGWSGGGAGSGPFTPVVTNNSGTLNMNTMVAGDGRVAATVAATMVATNSPTSWAITAGNTNNYFSISNSGVISINANALWGILFMTYNLTVQATNAFGTGTGTCDIAASNPNGNVFYVATNGNDGANGLTTGTAWLTLDHAAAVVAAGDIVLIRGGTYTTPGGGTSLNTPGTALKPIIYAAFDNEVAVFNGTGGNLGSQSINMYGRYVKVRGLVIQNMGYCGFLIGIDNVSIQGCNIHGSYRAGLFLYNGVGAPVDCAVMGCTVWDNARINLNQGGGGIWDQGISPQWADRCYIINNIVYQNWGEGIGIQYCDGAIVINNIVYDNYSVNIYPDQASNAIINNNFVYSSNPTFYRGGLPADGISFGHELSNRQTIGNIVLNNVICGAKDCIGFWGGTNVPQNNIVAGNTFAMPTTRGFYLDGAMSGMSGNIFRDNIVYNGSGAAGVLTSGTANGNGWTCDHNCWNGSGSPGGSFTVAGDVTTNPQFFGNPSGATSPLTLALLVTSPCIGAGVNVAQLTVDYLFNARSSPPSIGAFNGAN